ncbi:hypothetical protein [Bradyrhizobium sp. Tv2a-2]|uniref:hypothetical protein n=1 Tax=Bradyrhizobium sp. Tv2a-2 TaxID=113395 RepID=UPI000467308C|nr:hypothetical protein [Bradyrhizobium sp. Tv2a-2]
MQERDSTALRADCTLAAKFWACIHSALTAITYREKGEEAAKQLWVLLMRQHQKRFYLRGAHKLGIRDDEPPAVRAAKYHYLSNVIDNHEMEYIEETPRKVWIRYKAPKTTYAGVTMIALPGSISRAASTAWYPKNGILMGSSRLGFVSTKLMMEFEACDEGYFIEYEHDLAPGEEYRFEHVTQTPEFDPSKAPRLDPELWPEERRLKARRNWSLEYVRTTVDCLFQMFGQQTTCFLVSQVMRGIAIQLTHELKRDIGIEGTDASSVTDFLYCLQRACGQSVQLTESQSAHRIHLRSHLPFKANVSEPLRAAMFEFTVMAARVLNGRISVTRVPDGQAEFWEISNTGRWLW